MNTFQKLITSSANSENISLLLKGLATFVVIFGADATIVSQLNSDLMSIVTKIFEVVALGYSVWGGARKIRLGRWSASK